MARELRRALETYSVAVLAAYIGRRSHFPDEIDQIERDLEEQCSTKS